MLIQCSYLENGLDALLADPVTEFEFIVGDSLGLPATGMFFICAKTSLSLVSECRSRLDELGVPIDSPNSSLLVSLLNCSLSLLSTTLVRVGTVRPRFTTKPSWLDRFSVDGDTDPGWLPVKTRKKLSHFRIGKSNLGFSQ